jgi:hypothetical protein
MEALERIEEAMAELETFVFSEGFNELTEEEFEELQEFIGKLIAKWKAAQQQAGAKREYAAHQQSTAHMSPEQKRMAWQVRKSALQAKTDPSKRGAGALAGADPTGRGRRRGGGAGATSKTGKPPRTAITRGVRSTVAGR